MKKLYFLIIFLAVSLSGWSQLLTEPFNYTPHATQGLAAQSNSAWLPVNTGDSMLIDNGSLTYAGLAASTGNKVIFEGAGTDYYSNFASQTSGSVYCSFILNVSSLGSLNATGGYFAGFIQSGSTTSFGGTVWTRLSTTAGRYNVGISTRSNSTISWVTTDLIPGTPCFIVATYDINPGAGDDVSRIWLNTAAIGGSEPAADATAAAASDLTSAARFLLRQVAPAGTPFTEFDELRVGTTWASVTPSGAATPTLTATVLTAFGNVCINTSAGPNSFTITGTTLTAANVTVGALTGFTYSTTSGGTYTSSLSLTQPGGAYSQQIFVRFNPTLVQSYSGNIPVGGGGATAINVAASGAGVNTMPSVTSGAASAITSNSATVAGSITATGCTAVTAYGVEYSLVNGFANGSGTAVASTNLAGGNFSSNLTGLTPGLTYYFHAYATNGGGTAYGAQGSFTTIALTPVITVTPLTSFGNICINTVAGPNSFTINGTNLTTANISVGPLAGYTFSTTSGGTYTASLNLTQPGGTYSQQIFVRFSPVAVQSYNGTIPVTGGGAPATSVSATGAGVNTAATVTSGAASAITQTSATVAGTIPSIGCSAVTAYGIEYSTTNGFANGSGTAVAATNLTGINFSSGLTGLTAASTYYYHAYATNGGGTSYGAQASFTTSLPVLTATPLTSFGANCVNTTAGPNSFTINSTGLLASNVNVGPLNGYSFSTTAGGVYTASLSLTHPAGPYTQTIYVKFNPTAVQSYNGNIPVSGGGAATINVGVTGSGVNGTATVATGNATVNSPNSVTMEGSVSNTGCSAVTGYGIEYSGISGLANGLGTDVPATNISSGNFSATINGLVQGATYYYKAYAVNSGGKAYGPEKTFTTSGIPNGFVIYASPVKRGGNLHYTFKGIKPGHYQIQMINSSGQLVHQREVITQLDFIDDNFMVPGHLPIGPYSLLIASPNTSEKKAFMIR
ncbi:MAG TPA: hypothetical protein VK489_08345 [Ferruginibacter sp.]|nr:hypothetical protein [Ferruginibacter sp.]